jgi:hypothetical protein
MVDHKEIQYNNSMTKEDRAKIERIYNAFEAAFEALSVDKLTEIINAMKAGPIIGSSIYTPRWLFDTAELNLLGAKIRD